VAQALKPASERLLADNVQTDLKLDVRAYIYDGVIRLVAARLTRAGATNLRTYGGDCAPVLVVDAENSKFDPDQCRLRVYQHPQVKNRPGTFCSRYRFDILSATENRHRNQTRQLWSMSM
jgi:hypothetical protein